LNDLYHEIGCLSNNNYIDYSQNKNVQFPSSPNLKKIKANVFKTSMMKFTSDSEKFLYSKNPLPMNKYFYLSIAHMSHELIANKQEYKSSLDSCKILEESIREFYSLQHNCNESKNSFNNIPHIINPQNSHSFHHDSHSHFESQIKKKQDCALFKEENFFEENYNNKCIENIPYSDYSLDTIAEPNFHIDLTKRNSANSKYLKIPELFGGLIDLPGIGIKKKKVRSSLLNRDELNFHEKNENKAENFVNCFREDDKNINNKYKNMDKGLKKIYDSSNNIKDENKKVSDQGLSKNRKKQESSSDSENSRNEEESNKRENYDSETFKIKNEGLTMTMDKNQNIKIKKVNNNLIKSETDKSNFVKSSKISNKKTDTKNNDCYIINNNIIVVDNKVIVKNNEIVKQETVTGNDKRGKKESDKKVDFKSSNSKIVKYSKNSTKNNNNINNNVDKPYRCDRKGVPIVKGTKKHKVTFCDVGDKPKPLIEICHVDCYKKFNVLNTHGENSDRSCSCCILI